MLLNKLSTISALKRSWLVLSKGIRDVYCAMGRQEQVKLFQWLGRKLIISTEVSCRDCYLLCIRRSTRDTNIRLKFPFPILSFTMKHWLIYWIRITEIKWLFRKIRKDMYLLRDSLDVLQLMKKMLSKFCFKDKITRLFLNTNSIKIVQELTRSLLFI